MCILRILGKTNVFVIETGQFLAPPLLLLASDANGQALPISSITITHLLVALICQCLAKLHFRLWLFAR